MTIARIGPEHDPLLRGLFSRYLADMAEWFAFDPATAYDAAAIWTPSNEVYLARVNGTPAGFALLGPAPDHGAAYDVHEFFVMSEFRRAGLGQRMAQHVWDAHPGSWLVRVLQANQPAAAFWRTAVNNYTKGTHVEESRQINGRAWSYFTFSADPHFLTTYQ